VKIVGDKVVGHSFA